MLDGWDLQEELDEAAMPYSGKSGRRPAKLVHNIILSMPAGTPADKMHSASKDFAREQFALKNRYAMVLHTDQEHPHVHLVVKAMGEDGERLNTRKATLREWRSEFARHLREHGVEANAAERQVGNVGKAPVRDGVYRAEQRGDSTKQRGRPDVAVPLSARSTTTHDDASSIMDSTRRAVPARWEGIYAFLKESPLVATAPPIRTQDVAKEGTPYRDGFAR